MLNPLFEGRVPINYTIGLSFRWMALLPPTGFIDIHLTTSIRKNPRLYEI